MICYICNKNLKNFKSLSRHITTVHTNISKEEYYRTYLQKNLSEHICPVCNKLNNFISLEKGYTKNCSRQCNCKNTETKERIVKTNLDKYGTACVLNNDSIKNKIKYTNLKKFGVENVFKNKEIQSKIKDTNLKKYNKEYPSQNKNIYEKINKTNFKKYFQNLLESEKYNKFIIPLFTANDYIGKDITNKYKFKCIKCNLEFEDHLDNNRVPRCYNCYPIQHNFSFTSNVEIEIKIFLLNSNKNLNILSSVRNIIPPYELDIYIPEHNLAIEFNGLYWHSEENGKDKNYHLNKTNLCKEKGIQLIHVFEDEWIENSDIVKSMILNKLRLINNKIYARKCEIREVYSKESKKFLINNHIQGSINSKYKLGLYYQNELVSLLTIGNSRFNKNYDFELHRYCSKLNTNVIGGFSKLLKHFRKNQNGSIITYADLRYGTGDVYLKNGFTKLKPSPPNFFYIKNQKRYSRIKFQKYKLNKLLDNYDPTLTAKENMALNNYYKIWDCGNNVYILKKDPD